MSKKSKRNRGYALVGPMADAGATACPSRTGDGPAVSESHAVPTHEQVAERARVLWEQQGCPPGQDLEIWLAAESEVAEGRR